ncbi:alkaline phosphatase [Colwellia psychrerythraea]|uniref:Alkaline phosphatase n=1 Tax=Colwellia psychrerythraea TaxID=28229 RepID=A0A099KD76_COLPS|nr:alkaline phosphatase [Colwellia psychrerythraea]KGJ88326.1 Alkaline phosphatase [Colwellia psychrerythraea]
MKKFIFYSLILLSMSIEAKPTNIIFLIGDGMGPAYTTAYRYYSDNPKTPKVESTIFDTLLIGSASTYPDDDTIVTDSAAAATALATGHKTYNGAVGINRNKQKLTSILKTAKSRGYNTGIVVTSELSHATPAGFVAHSTSRKNKYDIAKQFYTNKFDGKPIVDLMLGGGTKYFNKELTLGKRTKTVTKWLKSAGYKYFKSLDELDQLNTLPALGLFAEKGLTAAINSEHPDRLSIMTEAALRVLGKDEKPFFLMIEASQIDWCGHSNDISCAMAEMDDFAKTLTMVKHYVDESKNTLMVATADHSTGGLSLGYNKIYQWKADIVKQVHATTRRIAEQLEGSKAIATDWHKFIDFSLTESEERTLAAVIDNKDEIKDVVRQIIINRSKTGWTTKGHDAVDVQVFAAGVGSRAFRGFQDNTDISRKLNYYLINGA